jgi:hypothetical protein
MTVNCRAYTWTNATHGARKTKALCEDTTAHFGAGCPREASPPGGRSWSIPASGDGMEGQWQKGGAAGEAATEAEKTWSGSGPESEGQQGNREWGRSCTAQHS